MRKTALPLLSSVSLIAALGCTARPLTPIVPNDTIEVIQTYSPNSAIDILFVVDDSGSMAEEHEELSTRFDAFLTALQDYGAEFHLGIATTDYRGDGALQGPVIRWTDADPLSAFRDQLDALTTTGFGMEAGLLTMQLALEAAVADPGVGFYREEALLAVVFVSDEDDCSGWAELNTPATATPEDTLLCHDPSRTTPVEVFADYLVALKGDADDVVVTTFTGGPGAVTFNVDVNGAPVFWAAGTNNTGIFPACEGGFGYADPANRYHAFADALRGHFTELDPVNVGEESICQADLGAPLAETAQDIILILRDDCLRLVLDGYGDTADDVLPVLMRWTWPDGTSEDFMLGEGFDIIEDFAGCPDSGLRILFDSPPPSGVEVEVIYQGTFSS